MKNVILIRYGEIHLKGQNRPYFLNMLTRSIKGATNGIDAKIIRAQGRYFLTDYAQEDEKELINRLKKVFGIYSISIARELEKDWEKIVECAIDLMRNQVEQRGGQCTFKVIARRSDKHFFMNSNQMCPELGGRILDAVEGTKVDVHNPMVPVSIEIRENAYIYLGEILGQGGMPVGCNGKAMLLLSGGIDSPVAGHMIMKRGVAIECVHFHSFPYTSERAKDKVISLAKILGSYCGHIKVNIVNFTQMQLKIYEKCPDSQTTVVLRCAMMQIAEKLAQKGYAAALITGEAIGQVASQTLESLYCTNSSVEIPVFRPLIGFDKIEIMDRARAIGTYETSILPFEDCCTIFTPKHPVTKPKLESIQMSMEMVDDWAELVQKCVDGVELVTV